MGEALAAGLLAAGWAAGDLVVVEALPDRRAQLAEALPGVVVTGEPAPAAGAVIAVKPPDAPEAAAAAVSAGAGRLLSIAAGVTLARLEAAAGPDVPVVRAMPNTPALVGAGAAAIAGGAAAGEDDLAWAEALLGAVGTVVRVPEASLDAVTGLSGSGPAYVFLVAEALMDAGVAAGLPRATAEALVRQTVLGAGRLLAEGDGSPQALRAAVTSPGGTTEAGVRVLEEHGVRQAVEAAVLAATARSHELGTG
jgi:pyrroline-5-carboxylate reductase